MSLEALYKAAAAGTYVGKVRTSQEESSGATTGVNFMDGERRSRPNTEADEFQTEFTRNTAGSNVGSGAQPPAGLGTSTTSVKGGLSRWTDMAVKLAFDGSAGDGPASLVKGFYHTPTTFRVKKFGDSTANIHNYVPATVYTEAATGGYINKNRFARDRYNSISTSS
jgi:hypothetical protein